MKIVTKIINVLYYLVVILFLLDVFTRLDIKNQNLKSFVYLFFLIGTIVILFWNIFIIRKKKGRLFSVVIPIISLIIILIMNPIKILYSSKVWHTQTVLYQNEHLKFKKIEFQMQDIGALGYNKRTVEVIYLTEFFMITYDVPKDIDSRIEWVKVDKEINELNLKY